MNDNNPITLGYCSACRLVVELNEGRCPLHPRRRVENICITDLFDVERVRASIMMERYRKNRKTLIRWLVGITLSLVLGYVIIFMVKL